MRKGNNRADVLTENVILLNVCDEPIEELLEDIPLNVDSRTTETNLVR